MTGPLREPGKPAPALIPGSPPGKRREASVVVDRQRRASKFPRIHECFSAHSARDTRKRSPQICPASKLQRENPPIGNLLPTG
ncbi:MAG: hypothetical protein C6P37_14560 [Caldibacillus debilis]|uniref:Uncharacterized protein n=1 Tax=Caldibacillus debilis TaxID=301148 RepID=A0A3E0JZM0_9BACI|nr:MAG: hypothetical protein C6P37_14560 [Caldibacillus debilis]